ncbi:MAG: translocation/assembly module TamB domain-containing protein [Candidatus Dadabacteria bacterium]
MQTEKPQVNRLRKAARITLRVILYVFLFIVLIFLLILTPPVQRFLTGRVQVYLEKKLQTKVRIDRIGFDLAGNINLHDIYIEDKTKDTLVAGGNIKAHLNIFKFFNNEVEVKELEFQNVTAKVKRILPDTVFNYQFVVDAFATEKAKSPDTAKSKPLKLDVSDVTLDNVNLTFTDVITGSDMFAHIGYLTSTIDTLDPYGQRYSFPTLIARNTQARIKQMKPLIEPKPMAEHVAEAATPGKGSLNFGTVDLSKVSVKYDNDVSALYSSFNFGTVKLDGKMLDIQHNRLYLDELDLGNSTVNIHFGKKQLAEVTKQEVKEVVKAEVQAGWDLRSDRVRLTNNTIIYNDDNQPKLTYGLDYSHIDARAVNLNVDRMVLATDSVTGLVKSASFREKSGLILNNLQTDFLYATKQMYFKNLYIKTPGTEIRKSIAFEYPSIEAFQKDIKSVIFDFNILNSRVQVKDILAFAPQLRSRPAFSNPSDIWTINLVGNGTVNKLNLKSLQFDGFRDTHINASGTLSGLMDPNTAGGRMTIYNLHTSQSDIASLTGQRLSNKQVNLPETFDVVGTIAGNAGRFNTNLNINSSSGFIAVDGSFANIMSPTGASYNASVRTRGLQLGRILRQQGQIGTFTANMSFNGRGFTPNSINTRFAGTISSGGFNNYQYHDVRLSGTLKGTAFNVKTNINDPNIDVNLVASGNYGDHPHFKVNGMVDSIKLKALHFTTEPLFFRGKVDATVANINPNYLDANILVTRALFISRGNRLPLDSLELLADHSDTGQYIRLRSDIANALITGQYRITDLGNIIQDNIRPYFSVADIKPSASVKPYNIHFTADVVYTPVLSSFIPDLKKADNIHAQGSLASGQGLSALITAPYLLYQDNELKNTTINVNTDAAGMHAAATVGHLKSGNSFDVNNVRLYATALHNNIDFKAGIDDKNAKNKYVVAGNLTQPASGTYVIHLSPDSLLLNYEKWSVSPDNSITISPNSIVANHFTLIKGNQQVTLQSLGTSGIPPLQVTFSNFRISTVTGFIKSDSLLVDGVTNGTVTFKDLKKQPLFTSNLTITDLTFRQDTVGNVNLIASTVGNGYQVNATITGKGNDVQLIGTLAPEGTSDIAMNLDVNIRQLQLKSIEGALKDFVTSADGRITGNIKLSGSTSNPNFSGKINFDKASISTVALGGPLMIDGESLSVTRDGLKFNEFTIRDSSNHALVLNGEVLTSNLINYEFDLDVDATNFRVINTTKRQNSLYYGQMYITTSMRISGTEQAPVIDGSVTIVDGTDFTWVVPQQNPGIVSRKGIVEFVNLKEPENDSVYLAPYDSLNVSSLVGYDVAANIEIQKQAKFSIVIDEANGDFVNLQGSALFSAGIDPSGKTTLTGTYEIEQGAYQINYNFIQRRFEIQKGSKITWLGEPTAAQLNVTAIYVANTSPLDLVANYISAPTQAIRNTYLQKLPFQVILKLGGELMKPDVAFDIVLPTDKNYNVSPDIITNVDTRLTQLRQEPSELNKQVFSLLLLNRFVGENPLQSSAGGFNAASFARQSVSKLLTEQLNKLAEGLIDGVDLTFDVASTDDYTTGQLRNRTDLNVGLSKRLLNDRLTITVGSNFELEGPQQTNQQSNNIAGNIAINYQLSRDGKYLLRLYRKNDYYAVVDGYIIETGLNFIITLDYDKFAEILHRNKKVVNGTRDVDQKKQNPPQQ